MKRPLKKCCNGCDKPPHPPSWVLCEDCFAALDKKMHDLLKPREAATDAEGGQKAPVSR